MWKEKEEERTKQIEAGLLPPGDAASEIPMPSIPYVRPHTSLDVLYVGKFADYCFLGMGKC